MMKRLFHERKFNATVDLLDGDDFRMEVTKSTPCRDVFDQVCQHIGLDETDFFGLKFICPKDRQLSWLDNMKTIGKQLGNGPYHMSFRVKFYPPNPASVHEDITRYQIVLQVREDLLKGRLICSVPIHALLASYLIQAEKGDYDPAEHSSDYINDLQFMPNQDVDFLEKVHEFHKKHKGFTPADSEFHYLDNARKIPLFGMDLHDALDGDGTSVVLGVSGNGLHVILKGREISKFSWSNIHKVYFKSKRFFIDIRVVTEVEYEDLTIGFRCKSRTELKRLYRSAVDHHTFFRRDASILGSQKVSFFRLGSKFRYSGKKTFQQLKTSTHARAPPTFQRVSSQRLSKAQTRSKDKDASSSDARRPDNNKQDLPVQEVSLNEAAVAEDDGSPSISRNIVIAPSEEDCEKQKANVDQQHAATNGLKVTITISPPTPIQDKKRVLDAEDSCEDFDIIESIVNECDQAQLEKKGTETTSIEISSSQNEDNNHQVSTRSETNMITTIKNGESESFQEISTTETRTTVTVTKETEILTVNELNEQTVIVEEHRTENVDRCFGE